MWIPCMAAAFVLSTRPAGVGGGWEVAPGLQGGEGVTETVFEAVKGTTQAWDKHGVWGGMDAQPLSKNPLSMG